MSFEKLLESAKTFANDDFVRDLETAVATTTSTLNSTTERVSILEKELEGSISKKNKLRDIIKVNTGLEEISEENFTKFVTELKTKGGDETLRADNQKLQGMVGEYKSKIDEIATTYESKINSIKLENAILGTGEISGIESSVAKSLVLEKAKEGAVVSDKGIVYIDANGSTVLKGDGTPLTLSDRMAQLREDADYAMFFPDKLKKGGGKGVSSPSSSDYGVRDLSKLTRTEKAKLMKELSPADYQALVRANLNNKG
jgi:hypothetical protein